MCKTFNNQRHVNLDFMRFSRSKRCNGTIKFKINFRLAERDNYICFKFERERDKIPTN